jgi:tetratricopeptide (TPR) repeat protein
MKSFFLTLFFAASTLVLYAQKLDKAKDQYKNKKLTEAKTEIDNFLAVEKNQKNSEAYFYKAKIYGSIAADPALSKTYPEARDQAYAAIKTYLDLEKQVKEESKRYLLLTVENRAPLVDLYSGYSKDGATFYNAGNYNDALVYFNKTLDVFDLLAANGWTNNMNLDTTTTLYAGISAEKANKLDEAAKYYGAIASSKATGEGFIEIYKWLADHYKQKGDLVNASKYLQLGREVYPTDPFWSGFELEMLREKGTKDEVFAKYEQVIKENPTNHVFYFNYAVELYQAGYNVDSTKRPANSKELIDRATEQLKKSLEIKPDYANANMVLGQIYYNQGIDIANVNKTIRPPQGGKLKPEELKKKEELRNMMNKKYDEAIVYFEKVDQALGSQGKLKMEDKQFLKEAYDLMITIYEQRQDKDKIDVYTDKFNNVEKKH